MPSTWTQLKDAVACLVADPNYVGISDSQVEEAILTCACEVATELLLSEESTTISTIASFPDYTLDATAAGGAWTGTPFRIKKAMIQLSTYTWRTLKESNRRGVTVYPSQGLPFEYTFHQHYYPLATGSGAPTISFNYVPNAVYVVKLVAYVMPANSTANPNGMSLPAESEMLVILRAARRLLAAHGNLALLSDLASEDEVERKVARSGHERAIRGSMACR